MAGKLTDRQLEVLRLIGRGFSSKAIAKRLKISLNTVSIHRANIRAKTGIHSHAELIMYATKNFGEPTLLKNHGVSVASYQRCDGDSGMSNTEKLLILIASNDEESINNYRQVLMRDYELIFTNSVRDAFDLAKSESKPDLLIIEATLSDMDGLTLLAMVKTANSTKDICTIFVSQSASLEEEELALECGAVDYIRKPIINGILKSRVRTHVENKWLHDEIKLQCNLLKMELDRRLNEITHVQNLSLDALTELAKVRDNETGEHLVRTQNYVRLLAEWLLKNNHYNDQLEGDSISLMVRSAPLHDIGKVGIPDRILLKPGKLTPTEWQIMKLHPVRGSEALQLAELRSPVPIPYLRYAKEIARHHHEKWNGTGYPDRLAGNEIPLSARLMAVADVFDALISKRVYKPAWEINYARESILALSGIDFDPIIVQAFDSVFPETLEIAEKYADQ